MTTLNLTPAQFFYLQRAVRRDLENLEEMAPWDIYDEQEAHQDEVRLCKALTATLGRVEQEQVIPH